MPVENVYQNIANILQRIESIKRRFGVPARGQVSSEYTDSGRVSRRGRAVEGQSAAGDAVQGDDAGVAELSASRTYAAAQSEEKRVSSEAAKTSFREELDRKITESDSQNKPRAASAEEKSAETIRASDYPSRADRYDDIIKEASEKFGIPESLIQAIIKQESGFDNSAVSSKGAMGLMQLMPETADSLGVENPFNPVENILGGSRYLVDLLNQYNGNLNLALAAYNAGPNRVENRIPGISETKDFIDSVLRYYQKYQKFNKEEL